MKANHRHWTGYATGLAALLLLSASLQTARAFTFSTNSPLNLARAYHTTTLLSNGKLLIAGGYNGSMIAATELYDPATGICSTNGATLATPRHHHTATMLQNGKVLVAGGSDASGNAIGTAEIYDPISGAWTTTGSLKTPRYQHTATLLTNGMVLLAGGVIGKISGNVVTTNSAELYDPVAGTWSLTGPMNAARSEHTATLLANGQVLAAGGLNTAALSSAELYNPTNGTWTLTTGFMTQTRFNHTATLLASGEVLVAGGETMGGGGMQVFSSSELFNPTNGMWMATSGSMSSPHCLATATLIPNSQKLLVVSGFTNTALSAVTNKVELYDPVSQTWQASGQLNTARASHTATLLPAGQIVLIGGYNGTSYLSSVETCVATNGTWSALNPMSAARYHHTLTLLTNGQILAVGGDGNNTLPTNAEVYTLSPGNWTNTTGPMNVARYEHTAILLTNGQVLVAGGYNGTNYFTSTELYNPASGLWTVTNSMNFARGLHTATMLLNGQVLVAGGTNAAGNISSTETFDPATGIWTTNGPMNTARYEHTGTLLRSGKVLVTGGFAGGSTYLKSVETYDPSTGIWTTNNPMNAARARHTATLLPSGKVLVAGGFNSSNNWLNSAELFDPNAGTWTFTGSMSLSRQDHVAKLLVNGEVLVAGGDGDAAVFNTSELYEPSTGTWVMPTTSMIAARSQFAASIITPAGWVVVCGGSGNTGALNSTETYLGFGATSLPGISTLSSSLALGSILAFNGGFFRGVTEASGGNGSQDSPTDYPVLQLHGLESGQSVFVPVTNWTVSSLSSVPVTNFPIGWALVTVLVNGVPSQSKLVNVEKGTATVNISNLVQTFDGAAEPVTVTTVPAGLAVTVTYNGLSAAPTNSGSYTVVAVVNDTNYLGAATNTLTILPPPSRNFGVDASHFQNSNGIPETNWTMMYTQGLRFAFVKATEGLTGPDDPTMATNFANATQAGLLVGVYHFAHPENRPTTNGAVVEADHLLAYASNVIHPGSLRPVLDIETTSGVLTPSVMTDWVLAFSREITLHLGAGAAPIVYCTQTYANNQFDNRLANNALWLQASGGGDPTFSNPPTNGFASPTGVFTNWAFWQYTVGSAGGITGIDLDVCHDEFVPLSAYLIPAAAPGFAVGSASLGANGFQLSFTNVPGTHFTLLSTTNITLALSNWTAVGSLTEISPGHFVLTDAQATNIPRRFYRVRSP